MQSQGERLRRIAAVIVTVLLVGTLLSTGAISSVAQHSVAQQEAQQANEIEEIEPNDNRSNANHIPIGRVVTGDRNFSTTDAADWFAFNVTAGTAFNVERAGLSGTVSLYGPDGTLLRSASAGTPDTWSIGTVADQTGTYYIRVEPRGTYSFVVRTARPDQFEPNDNRSTATPIDAGNRRTATLFEGEQDWYVIDIADGQNLTVVVERMSGAADPGQNVRVDIFTERGERVSIPIDNNNFSVSGENRTTASGVSSGRFVKVRVTDAQAGTYYIRISGVKDLLDQELTGFVEYALTATATGEAVPADDSGAIDDGIDGDGVDDVDETDGDGDTDVPPLDEDCPEETAADKNGDESDCPEETANDGRDKPTDKSGDQSDC